METAWFIVHRAREVLISLLMYFFFTVYTTDYPDYYDYYDCERFSPCDNGAGCITDSIKCDGYNDCGDNSDEHECGGM